jgi:predicted RNase H-like nuclease (RuvC/YqgF family)
MTQVENLKNEITNLKRKLKYYKDYNLILGSRLKTEAYVIQRERSSMSQREQQYIDTISKLMTHLEEKD